MATADNTIAFLQEQLAGLDGLSIRKMFGEYGVWLDGKTVALVCNDQLFVKVTAPGQALASDAELAPAYRGAKPSLMIAADMWEDGDWLMALLQATAAALPTPKPKKPKK